MKTLFTFTLSFLSFSIAFSQAPLNISTNEQPEIFSRTVTPPQKNNRQFVSEWYNYGETLNGMGGNISYFRNYLFPDTTVVATFSGSLSPVWKHSYGQMCDPSSPNFASNTLIDENATYTLDSLLIWYRYYRFQTLNPDTLVIQVFEHNEINFSADPWADDRSYANVNYDTADRRGANPSYEYTVLLGNNDTATALQKGIVMPVGITIPAGNKAAATITYYPGNPHQPGDTIDPITTALVLNKINAFTMYDYKDLDKIQNQYFYNNGMIATSEVRYNTSTNGWNGQYLAGNAFSTGYYHLDMAFKLTSNSVGVFENCETDFGINLFPSVSSVAENTLLQIQSETGGKATVSIVDLTGKKLVELIKAVEPGTNKTLLPADLISGGMYFVNVVLNGVIQTKKLIKI